MTIREVINAGFKEVYVIAYGYTEINIFGGHWEPFARKRTFVFRIDPGFNEFYLVHKWLYLEEPVDTYEYELKNGKVYLDDPELYARNQY